MHQLSEMMMRLTRGEEGKEMLGDLIVYLPVLQSPRKRESFYVNYILFRWLPVSPCLFILPFISLSL